MASLIEPKCANDLYTMPTFEMAKYCGTLSGYFTTAIFSLLMISIGIYLWYYSDKTTDPNTGVTTTTASSKSWSPIISVTFCLFIMWIFIPWLTSWSSGNSWNGYQARIDGYITSSGGKIDRAEAIRQIQSKDQAQMQADATASAGMNIASAILSSNSSSRRRY